MYTLGIHGGINTANHFRVATPVNWLHDAAAVLCRDGEIVAAAEEERFLRIKHATHFPVAATRFCLDSQGITLDQVDRIVLTSEHMNQFVAITNKWQYDGTATWRRPQTFKTVATDIFSEEFGVPNLDQKVSYAGHHLSHALSAVCLSGFEDCLCVVMDGWGDGLTGLILSYHGGKLDELRRLTKLGPAGIYLFGTQLIGYAQFDEYKVMGLAPYGNPQVYRAGFEKHLVLGSEGHFEIRSDETALATFTDASRAPGAPLEQHHKDFAAALQATTENIVLHVMKHFKQQTGHKHLCLAGGVAQNCTANGTVLLSRLFDDVFVQPAAYDAGCAIGAAIHGYLATGKAMPRRRMTHLYWGYATPERSALRSILDAWSEVVDVEDLSDPSWTAAKLIAGGSVIAWVQGCAEFGARALGNRSILADPRPAGNKARINAMVKKREGYRPFAPSVLDEHLHEYFDVPKAVRSLPFMVFVVKVKKGHRELLGAVTHVDGTARVQSVTKGTNERYWRLIDGVRQLTGTPIVLNTSFNNHAEPIVNTPADALNCFLSTHIDALIVGDFLVTKKRAIQQPDVIRHLIPRMTHRFAALRQAGPDGQLGHYIHDRYANRNWGVSAMVYDCLLKAIDGRLTFQAVIDRLEAEDPGKLVDDLFGLWERRVFVCEGGC